MTPRFSPEYDRDYRMLIDGQRAAAAGGKTFACVDPYENTPWGRIPVATAEDVDRAVQAARRAFDGGWGRSLASTRAQLLRRFGDLIGEHAEELARVQVHENGKLMAEMLGGARLIPRLAHYYAGLAENIHGRTLEPSVPNMAVSTVKEPLGVVAAITPWNTPIGLLMWKLLPALAAGNTVVIKPSEVTPTSTLRLGELAMEAGFPNGVINIVTGFGPTGSALVDHPEVDKIAFTGSTATGKAIQRAAANRLARVTLELGGKSPNIIFADADIDNAVHGVMAGIFAATGQTCMGGSRVFVQDEIYDDFVAQLAAATSRLKLGDPLDLSVDVGPVASRAQCAKVLDYIEIGRAEGAQVVCGGARGADALSTGLFVMPTIFANVSNDSRLAQEEIFGPVVCVIRFQDEDDAIRMANKTDFGLAGAVWTRDLARAHRMVRRIRAGTVWVNTYRVLGPNVPFGGFKQSGLGRELGSEALEPYLETKAVWIDLGNEQMFGRR